jgi:hypothetical protein
MKTVVTISFTQIAVTRELTWDIICYTYGLWKGAFK